MGGPMYSDYGLWSLVVITFDVEMGNSSSELIDYFLKRSQRGATARK